MSIIKRILFSVFLIGILCVYFFGAIHTFNLNKLAFTPHELRLAESFFPKEKLVIKSQTDIVFIQNYLINNTRNGANSSYKSAIEISALLNEKVGSCFDRSLLLQKILLYNKIQIRPVYIFFSPFEKETRVLDFFLGSTNSHNVFEYYFNDDWFVLESNQLQSEPLTLNEYFDLHYKYKNVKYIRYLNNRNSYMIEPWFLPDIY